MNAESLQRLARDHFRAHAGQYALARDEVEARYVLNWGGFVNYSYRIADGRRAYHLKLALGGDAQASLRRWYEVRHLLAPYHTPRIVDWVELGDAAGMLFEVVPGTVPTLTTEVVDALVPALSALFADQALAAALAGPHAVTARDAFMDSFHERFTEDLRGIGEAPPPFVDAALLAWMHDEVARLRTDVGACSAFDERLVTPVHGDLWLNNIHWVDRNEWYLLDWDDVRIGDSAADVAALLGPASHDLRPLKLVERVQGALTPSQRARLPLLGRATLLDWVIDPLSDWVEAEASPEHAETVRAEKERVHREALGVYRGLYG